MQAIILAAGMGKRLGELTQNNTKCMVKVNGVTLIERLLHQLENVKSPAPLSRIVIVTGYEGQKLRDYISTLGIQCPIEYVDNPIYGITNNIYSLFLAKEYLLKEDTLLFESDLIFEEAVIDRILQNPYPSLALVDKFESWMDGTVVTLDEEDNIKRFIPGSKFSYKETKEYYKTVNIYKFSKEFSCSHYVPFLTAYSKALGNNEYYEQVLRVIALLDKPEIKALRLNGEAWYEIDDVQDLDIAESMFCKPEEKLKKMEGRCGGYWRYPHMLDFTTPSNPYFPNSRLMSELKANFDKLVRHYPSGMWVNSLLAGKYFGIRQDYVCVGNGAEELIKGLMESLEGKLGAVLPTMEEHFNHLPKERLVTYETASQDFRYSADNLINYFGDKYISTLLVVNPDNPSGNFIPKADILRLCEWAEAKGIRLIIDESFVDFTEGTPGNTLLSNDILEANPHLVVVKSISKSNGIPGLRLGIMASGNKDFISWVKEDIACCNINSLGEFYMQIFGKYEKNYQQACVQFMNERSRFMEAIADIPFLRVLPSQAAFFLCEVLPPHHSRELSTQLLEQFNILIKDCSGTNALNGRNFIRLAVKAPHENTALIEAMKSLNAEQ